MEHWDLRTLAVEPHQPKILHSARGEARSILINLPAGQELLDHQVHERHVVHRLVTVRRDGVDGALHRVGGMVCLRRSGGRGG
jgi:hypothetical protein